MGMPKISAVHGKREPEVKQQAVLDAALDIFAESGVFGASMPAIAKRAKVGTGTIYRYFPSKEALVNAVYLREKLMLRQILEAVQAHLAPKVAFDGIWKRLVDYVRRRPQGFRFLEMQDHLPYLDADSRALEAEILTGVAGFFAGLQHEGVVRRDLRPDVLLALIWGAFVNLFKAERGGYLRLTDSDIAAARDATWGMCLRGEQP